MNTAPSSPESASPLRTQHEPPSYLFVLAAGIATSALTLFAIYWLDRKTDDFHVMGWYWHYIIPIGAILVGMVAASGYGIVSWFSGIKIVRLLMVAVVVLQVGVYFGAQYIEFKGMHLYYKDTGNAVGFIEYFDLNARSFAWKQDNDKAGEPLGVWGYLFRALEIVGFAGGGLVVPALLCTQEYCDPCRRYMRSKVVASIPGSIKPQKFKKADIAGAAAHQEQQAAAAESARQFLEMLRQMAAEGRAEDFKKATAPLMTRKSGKAAYLLPVRYTVHLVGCRQCGTGWLKFQQLTGQGKQMKTTDLGRYAATPEFVTAMQARA